MTIDSRPTIQAQTGKRRREATVADLLAATKRLLTSGLSVSTLSVDRIAGEAGVSRATFYLHFTDKHALIARLADEEVAWRDATWVAALADPELQRETLDRIMLEITSRWLADRAILAAIIELAEYEPGVRATWRATMQAVADAAARQFRERWTEHPSRPPDPDTIAAIFTWMFERSCHQLLIDEASAVTVASAMSEVIWRVLDYDVDAPAQP